jgi:EF hand
MNFRKSMTAAALALVVAASPAAFGKPKDKQKKQDGQRAQAEDIYTQYDRNRDGRISRSEFPADPLLFDRADLNRDGMLTRAEAESFARSTNIEAELQRLDRNRDGAISRSEWRGDYDAFARLDRNGDGVLSQADRTNSGRRFHGLDRNRDGVVTRSEWRGNNRSFELKDRNNDGVLSGTELK